LFVILVIAVLYRLWPKPSPATPNQGNVQKDGPNSEPDIFPYMAQADTQTLQQSAVDFVRATFRYYVSKETQNIRSRVRATTEKEPGDARKEPDDRTENTFVMLLEPVSTVLVLTVAVVAAMTLTGYIHPDRMTKKIVLLSSLPRHHILDRKDKLTEIQHQFLRLRSDHDRKVVAVNVVGIPGSGKTVLAVKYCDHYKSGYSIVLPLNLHSLEALHSSLVLVTRHNHSGLPFDEQAATSATKQSILQLLQRLHSLLKEAPSWLIHVDGFGTLFDPLPSFFPLPGSTDWGNGSLIITRQKKYEVDDDIYQKTVDLDTGLNPVEAIQLVANVSKDDDHTGIDKVVKELDYMPLGLLGIAAFHRSRKERRPWWTWNDSLSQYNKRKGLFRLPVEVNPYNKSLVQAVDIVAGDLINSSTSECGPVLILFGMLKATHLAEIFVEKYLESLNRDPTALTNDQLVLITIDNSNIVSFYNIHQVTQYVLTNIVKETVVPTTYERNVEAIIDALIGIHEEFSKRSANNSILLRSVRSYFKVFCDDPLVSVDKRILMCRALGDVSVLTVEGEQARLKYTNMAVEIMETERSGLSLCQKAQICLQALMSAVNLVNDTAAWRYYRAGRNFLEGQSHDVDRDCRDTTLGELYFHYGSLMNTVGDYHHAERCFEMALPLIPSGKPELLFVKERLYDAQKNMVVGRRHWKKHRVVGRPPFIDEHIRDLKDLLNRAHKIKFSKGIAHLECKLADSLLNKRHLNGSDMESLLQYSSNSAELYKRIYGKGHFRYIQSVTTHSKGLIRAWRLDAAKESLSLAKTSFNYSGNLQHSTRGYWAVVKAHLYIAETFRTSNLTKKQSLSKEALALLVSSYNDTVRTLRYNHSDAAATMLAISYLYVRRAVWKVDDARKWLLRMAFHTFRIAANLERRSKWPLPCCELRFPCRRSQWFVLNEENSSLISQASSGECITGRKQALERRKSNLTLVHLFH
jgi:tetratricopeptide (TPR) repeat protein